MTYLDLRDFINKMTAKQLMMEVIVYSGNVDDTAQVINVSLNTPGAMGESLEGYALSQPFLVLE